MDPPIIAALITSLFALVVALTTAGLDYRRARKLQVLQEQLDERAAERDYEYEARKRLYAEVAPLLFQLNESTDAALNEILRLCRPSHWPRLALTDESREALKHKGWIGSTGYDTTFAAYALLAPLASYRFIHRRLTVVDLGLDVRVHTQWILLRALYESFWRDEEIAALEPSLEYAPRVDDWRTLRTIDAAKHWWQGVTRGRLDNAISMIIHEDEAVPSRLRTFGEFESIFKEVALTGDHREKTLGAFANALFDFRADARPVFWRLLAIQAVLHKSLHRLSSVHGKAPITSDFIDSLYLDRDLQAHFNVECAEPLADLSKVVDAYIDDHVRKALAEAIENARSGT